MKTLLRNSFLVTTDPDDLVNASSNGNRLEEELRKLYKNNRLTRSEFSVLVTRVRSMNLVIDNIGVQTVSHETQEALFFN